jgi:hypothetical protein
MRCPLRRRSVHLLLFPSVLILASACEGPREPRPPAAEAPPASGREEGAASWSGLSWETRTLERQAVECEEGSCASVSLEYPEFTAAPGEGGRRALNRYVREIVLAPVVGEEPAASPEALAAEVLRENERFLRELPEAAGGWFLDRTVKVVHQTPRVLSLEATESSYLGGAHPNSRVTYASFDPATGRRIALAELFLPDFEERLRQVAEERFREVREIPPGADLAAEGFEFEGGRFALNDNFAILEDGLVFYYNPYEIGAYALGPTAVKLTREDLAGLVLPDGPLGD